MRISTFKPDCKKRTYLLRCFYSFIVFIFLNASPVSAQLITEPFNYTPHATDGLAKQSASAWFIINSGDSVLVATGNLNYSGLLASSGNKITYGGAGTDYYRGYASQTTGTVYSSFLLNITSLGGLNTTGGYTTGLLDGTTAGFASTLWIRLSGTTNFNIGINPRTTAANTVWLSSALNINTTYLVVVATQIVAGLANDISKIWLNPVALGGTEPAADGTATNTGTDLTSIQRVFLRQDAAGTTPGVLEIDEMRVGTTWSSVTPSSAPPAITTVGTLSAVSTTYGTASPSPTTFNVSGSNITGGILVTPPTGYEISQTAGGATGYANTQTVAGTGTISSTTIYARLKKDAPVVGSPYSGNIICSSTGATSQNVATVSSTVSAALLTITADDRTKIYNTVLVLGSTAFTSSGLKNGETIANVTLSAGGAASNATTAPGTYPITISAATGGSFTETNYAITYVSGSLLVNKANQAISFAPLPDKNDTDVPYTLTATASSGLTVSYISSNTAVATISGNTVTIVAAGTTIITASQAGDINYNSAAGISQNQVVLNTAAQNQTITFNALGNKIYGDAPFTLNGTASSGLTVTYQSSNASVATISGNTVTILAPGNINITASQAGNASFNPAPDVVQSLTVNTKTLTLSGAVAQDKIYNGNTTASIDLTAAILNGIVGTDVVTISGSGTFADPNAGTGIAVSTNLSLGGADAAKYTLTQPSGLSANITQAPQAITFNSLVAKIFGDVPFTLTASASSGLAVTYTSSNTAVATISGNTVTITGGGTTTITASQAGNINYSAATDVLQAQLVNPASQTITFAALPNKITTDAPFSLTGTASSALAVTYQSSNAAVATVSGNVVTIHSAGVTNITASQSGNANYNAAVDVIRTLTVGYPLLAAWDFTGQNATVTSPATFFNVNLISSNLITRGAGAVASSAANSFRTTGFQNNGISTSNTDYFQTTLGVNGGKTLSLSSIEANFGGTSSFFAAPGVTSQFAFSLNGTTFTLIGSPVTSISLAMPPIDLTGISALQNVASNTTVTFRYYASGQTTTGGWGFASTAAGVNGLAFGGSVTLPAAPVITSSLTATGSVGSAFSYTITASNTPSSYNATGLPAGLTINTTTGIISGTPTTTGSSNVNITATNGGGSDTKTLVLTINPGSQTITFNSLVAKTYGDAPFGLTGTASSGLTVIYQSSNLSVATISGNSVTIVGAGSTVITASQPGDANWNTAPDVTQTLVVNKASQVITFNALADKLDTDGPFTLTATTNSGLTILYSSSNTGVATISGNTVTITGPGNTIIIASQPGDQNYNPATSVSQNQQVINTSLQSQVITFGSISNKIYGDAPFQLSGSSSSGLTLSYASSDPTVASVAGDMVTIHKNGTTTITASQAGNGSYNPAAPVSQPFTVNVKNLTLTGAVAQNKVYDGNTSATIDLSSALLVGIVGTDVVTVSGSGSFADANAGIAKPVATTLVLGGADASKYTLTQPTLAADISQAAQTITFNSLPPKNTADVPFALSGTTTSGLAVTYTSSNAAVATISGNMVTITGPGTTLITASQAGNQNYAAAPTVTQTLTVTLAPSIVTWNFGTTTGNAAPSSAVPAGLSISNITQVNNNGITTMLSATSASNFSGASAQFNAAAAARNNGFHKDTTTYFEFTLTPAIQKRVTLNTITFGSRSTGTGPTAYTLRSSQSGYTSDLASGTTLANSTWALRSPATTATTSGYGSPVTYRIYGYNGVGATYLSGAANWRVDDITVNLLVEPAPACSGTPSAGTASAATPAFCGSGNTTISLIGNTDPAANTGIAIQWYSSVDNSSFLPVAGAIGNSLATGTLSQTTYYYSIITCSNSGLSATSNTVTVTINPIPAVSFTGLAASYCSNAATATLTGSPAGGTFSGPGISGNTFDPAIAGAGTHTITYTYSNGTCSNAASSTVTVNAAPVVSFTGLAASYCSNAAFIILTGNQAPNGTFTGAGVTDNGNGTSSFDPSIAGPGAHSITYSFTDGGGCFNSQTQSTTVTIAPAATINYSGSPYCNNAGSAPVTQTGTTGGNYSSTTGLVINASSGMVDVTNSTAGTYTVTYTIASNGPCAAFTTTASITITTAPTATISYSGSPYCTSGGTATVTHTGTTGGTYSAATGLTLNGTSGTVTLGTSTPGLYTVTYTVAASGGCGIYTTTASITVNAAPSATIAYAGSPYCTTGGTATVTHTGTNGGAYSAPAGLTINSVTGVVTLATSTAGTYTVTYTVAAAGGCAAYSTTASITVQTCVTTITLNLKVFLEGFYRGGSTMVSTLFDLGMSGDATATDNITVNLWSPTNLSSPTPNYTANVVLHNNGTATVTFPGAVSGNNYYIAVKHRNSMETWSKNPVAFATTTSYDFSTGLLKAYDDGINPPMANMTGGVYALYGGEVNQDFSIDGGDANAVEINTNLFAFGYDSTDANGDGATDGQDANIVESNTALFLFYARPF